LSTTIGADVAVIGGGPAGAIAAHALAKLGRSVVLCEAAEFPRDHIGISLSAGVSKQLAFIGLAGLLDSPCHLRDVCAERRWGSDDFAPAIGLPSILVDRGVFDADLLGAVQRTGVTILQPAFVRALARCGHGWRLEVRGARGQAFIEAKFVIEATGRRTRFRRRHRQGATTLALCGYWRGTLANTIRISAQPTSWCWGAPTSADRSILVCFVDPQEFRRTPGSLRDRYLELARHSGVLPTIDALTMVANPVACDATPYLTDDETAGLLRIGDADAALDPLSSSGVQAAIQSALAAGPIVNTLLAQCEDGAAALEYWRRRRASRMSQHHDWSQQLYSQAFSHHPTRFWAVRCRQQPRAVSLATTTALPQPDQIIRLSEDARFVLAPCLSGSVVKRLECVDHVNLLEPVAFVAGIHIAPLLQRTWNPAPAKEVLMAWSAAAAPSVAYSLLTWAWHRRILI
jgi:2-polyprenyl-6-methoxyphenol hydroxylase-like FAD-dependent oxidoreductase